MDPPTRPCHSIGAPSSKPKNCVSLDETTVDPNEIGRLHELPTANTRTVTVAHRLFFRGFSNPSHRRIITLTGRKPATDTLVTDLITAIALTVSVDSRRIYCIETAYFGVSSCATRRVKQLAAVENNVVVVLLVAAAQNTEAVANDIRMSLELLEEAKNVALILTGAGAEEIAVALPELAAVLT